MTHALRTADWIDVGEAAKRIVENMEPLSAEQVPLLDALGRVLSEDVVSPLDHPPWDNSAMDGFAVRSEDVRGAAAERPVVLRVLESIPAGRMPMRRVSAGEATEIMTGAPLPEGADCVIRVEHTERDGYDRVSVVNDMDAGRNVRPRGEDVRAGSVVLERGRVLRAAEIGLLATVGRGRVSVHRAPQVAILSTGDELADLPDMDEVLAGRKIVNSNSYALAAAVRATACQPLLLGIARDEATSLRTHLERGLAADAIITSAGASVGEHDVVKDVLEQMGMHVDFWRVRMRPGSPFSFGTLPRQDGSRLPVFGLPGNPVSALVTFEVLVRPALRRMTGRSAVYTPTLPVRAAMRIESKRGLTHFLRVKLRRDAQNVWFATLTGPQGSGLISSMAHADALLVVPLDVAVIEAGDMVAALRLAAIDETQHEPGY